jgi:hypothetical protein
MSWDMVSTISWNRTLPSARNRDGVFPVQTVIRGRAQK